MADEILNQGLVFDENGALRPITREEADKGLHAPKAEEEPAEAPKPEAEHPGDAPHAVRPR